MNQLLVWPLSDQMKLLFICHNAGLATITCCDQIDLVLSHHDASYVLLEGISGCGMQGLHTTLQNLVQAKQLEGDFFKVLFFRKDQLGQFLIEIRYQQQPFGYVIEQQDILQAWACQLELLQIVMEENDKEKKSRGQGCC